MDDNYIKFRETELVFKRLSRVLEQLHSADLAELKKYFTQYVLIVFYREFEDKLRETFKQALENHFDNKVVALIDRAEIRLFKGIKVENIKEAIDKWFGQEAKQKFKHYQSQQEEIIKRYGNFITNRHHSAHSSRGLSISWEEIKNISKIGEEMIKIIIASLNNST